MASLDMASLDFPALYFTEALIEASKKISFHRGHGQRFCTGPHCSPIFWNQRSGEPELYGGPDPIVALVRLTDLNLVSLQDMVLTHRCNKATLGNDLTGYSAGLIETGASRLPRQEDTVSSKLPYQGSIEEQILKCKSRSDAETSTRTYKYVSAEDPTITTIIIDWQSTSIEPAFLYQGQTQTFAALPAPSQTEILGQETTDISQTERDRKNVSIFNQTYNVVMTALIPGMRTSRLLDPALFGIFYYCHTTWTDSAVMLRRELLELDGSCPCSPNEEELRNHKQDSEDFEVKQRLMFWLMANIETNADDWVPNEHWVSALEANRAAYRLWIETARESEGEGELGVEKADILWPFDARR
ncbi:uncharacterized protein N7525_011342 [Penicillium rubens]|uniref:uncharacterized protein n=1 Tax=Penicillium rubens TaxID=1108849 RepID=UPI002A59B4A2|nr:uncharacterized protein N7525_011342 [Penicillium rubens]KAJ5822058.1 hypothetical protein N7525_011342 [Penicillium rubens]